MSHLAFVVPGPEHAALILKWRTTPRISRYMFTEVRHGLPEQEAWLRACPSRSDYRHWLILHGGRPIGLINLHGIDWARRQAQSGFYLGEEDALRLGGFVLPYLFNHAFLDLGFEAMLAEVMKSNAGLLAYNRGLGYIDDTPALSHVDKAGVRHDVCRLRLAREAWLRRKALQRFRAEFPWPAP